MKPSEFNSTETESFISDKNNGVVTKSFENAFKHCYVETRTGLCSRDLQLSSKNNEHLFFATITSPSLGSDRTIGFRSIDFLQDDPPHGKKLQILMFF